MIRIYVKGERHITEEAMRKRGIRGKHETSAPFSFLNCESYLVSDDYRAQIINWYNSDAGTKPGDILTYTRDVYSPR